MSYSPISICVGNFPARMRGAIIGVTTCFYPAGEALFAAIYVRFYQEGPVGNFFFPLAILCIVANLLSIWIIKPLPLQTDEDMHKEGKTIEVHSVCFYTDDGSNPTNNWYIRLGLGLMKLPAFYILSWWFFAFHRAPISDHDDVIKWKHFPRNCPFVREIHRSPVNFPHKGQWRGALMFSLMYACINDWVNNREAGDLRLQHGHYDVIVMFLAISLPWLLRLATQD